MSAPVLRKKQCSASLHSFLSLTVFQRRGIERCCFLETWHVPISAAGVNSVDVHQRLIFLLRQQILRSLESLIIQLEDLNCSCVHIVKDLNLDTKIEKKFVN